MHDYTSFWFLMFCLFEELVLKITVQLETRDSYKPAYAYSNLPPIVPVRLHFLS